MVENESTKKCLNCGNLLNKSQTKFCSRSCAATYNNKARGPMSEITKEKIKNTLLEKFPNSKKHNKSINNTVAKRKTSICVICGKEFNIDYKNRRRKTCSEECLVALRNKLAYEKHYNQYKYYLEHQEEFCRANYIPNAFKNEIIKEQGGGCAICGIKPEWNDKQLVFIMDHIDGDASNNKRNNLRCICPNCDSQLDTYKSKNKNSTRRNYWKEKIIKDINSTININTNN